MNVHARTAYAASVIKTDTHRPRRTTTPASNDFHTNWIINDFTTGGNAEDYRAKYQDTEAADVLYGEGAQVRRIYVRGCFGKS